MTHAAGFALHDANLPPPPPLRVSEPKRREGSKWMKEGRGIFEDLRGVVFFFFFFPKRGDL